MEKTNSLKKLLSGLIMLFLISFLNNCSNDKVINNSGISVDTSSFTYPYNIGSTWAYTRTMDVINISPDSIKHYFTEFPITSTGNITILYDTVVNGISTRCFLYNDSLASESRYYFQQTDTALLCIGYSQDTGGVGFPFSPSRNISYSFNGLKSKSLINIFTMVNINSFNIQTSSDSIYIEDPPVKCLVYPIRSNFEWLFKDFGSNLYINKKYMNFENIIIKNQTISCMKTQRIWLGIVSDIYFYDYHSKFGQIKRDYLIKNITVRNEFGTPIGYFDAIDVVNVTSFYIPE